MMFATLALVKPMIMFLIPGIGFGVRSIKEPTANLNARKKYQQNRLWML
jgi:hypothetical protein